MKKIDEEKGIERRGSKSGSLYQLSLFKILL